MPIDIEKIFNNLSVQDIVLIVVVVVVIYLLFRSNSCKENFDTSDSNVEAIKNLADISKAMMTTSGTLNIPANIANLQGDVNISGNLNILPKGVIVAWNNTAIPVAWALCDGTNGTPDLRGRFILGATQGSATAKILDAGISANVLAKTGGEETHVLQLWETPAHTHTTQVSSIVPGTGFIKWENNGYVTGTGTEATSGSSGSNYPHNNMPPFYVLVYIMKL